MTIRELQNFLISELENSQIEDADINARWILEDVLKRDRLGLIMNANEPVKEADEKVILKMLRRRKNNEPLQYILGHANFMGLDFIVTPAVLIPRPETELLVEFAGRNLPTNANILDIGTGSGCIPIALKHFHPATYVVGCDVSREALAIAKRNALNLKLDVAFVKRDVLLNDLIEYYLPVKFDLITSNPPYIPLTELASLKPEVRDNEPHLALFVDDDPLVFYRKISKNGLEILADNGRLIFEIHMDYGDEVVALMQADGYKDVICHNDLAGRPRMVSGVKSS